MYALDVENYFINTCMLGFTFFGQKSVLIKFLAYIKNLLFVNLKFSLVLHIPWLIGADHFK